MLPIVSESSGPLHDIVVLNASDTLAGRLLARLLGAQGARVLTGGVEVIARSEVDVLIAGDDTRSATLADLHRTGPRLISCSMPAFDASDDRSSMPAWEGVVMAAAGAYAKGGPGMFEEEWWPDGGIAFSPLRMASTFAACQAALGIAAALLARGRDGQGQAITVPLFAAMHEAVGARVLEYGRNAPSGNLLGSGVYLCRDGRRVCLVTVWLRHLRWFLEAIGRSELLDGAYTYDDLMATPARRAQLRADLADIMTTRTAEEWEHLGLSLGIPLVAIRTTAEWVDRGASQWVPAAKDVLARPAIRITPRSTVAAHTSMRGQALRGGGPLAGVRVLDVTRVLAAPTVARLMAELGADVVRIDGNEGESGLRQPILHEAVNRGKRCLRLNLRDPHDRTRFDDLSRSADLLITNLTDGAVDRLGLDAAAMRRMAPDLIHARVHTFGPHAPASEARGFAEIANAVTGVSARTFSPDERASNPLSINVDLPRTPFTDYAAGILGAFGAVLALYARQEDGMVADVETTLVDAATLVQIAFVEDAVAGRPEEPWHSLGWSSYHRAFATLDGWIFVGLDGADARRLLGLEESCPAEESGGAGAVGDEARLARLLEERLALLSCASAVAAVTAVGGAAHPVVDMDRLLARDGPSDLAGLRLEHSSAEFGSVVQPGPAIILSRTPMLPGLPPTELGEQTWRDAFEETA